VVLALAALVLLARGGVLTRPLRTGRAITLGAWAIAAYLSLNTLANLASASAAERYLAGPTAVMAALAAVVARRGTSPGTRSPVTLSK
jgi:hypothetical protein